jgi:hypothetical protein
MSGSLRLSGDLRFAPERERNKRDPLHFRDSRVPAEVSQVAEVRN